MILIIFGFRMIMECITDRQTDETLAGALILAVGRWGLRYMVVDNSYIKNRFYCLFGSVQKFASY